MYLSQPIRKKQLLHKRIRAFGICKKHILGTPKVAQNFCHFTSFARQKLGCGDILKKQKHLSRERSWLLIFTAFILWKDEGKRPPRFQLFPSGFFFWPWHFHEIRWDLISSTNAIFIYRRTLVRPKPYFNELLTSWHFKHSNNMN